MVQVHRELLPLLGPGLHTGTPARAGNPPADRADTDKEGYN